MPFEYDLLCQVLKELGTQSKQSASVLGTDLKAVK